MKTKNKIILTMMVFLVGSLLGWIMSKDILNNFLRIIPEDLEMATLAISIIFGAIFTMFIGVCYFLKCLFHKNKIIFTLLIFLFGSVFGWIMSKDILNNFLKIIPEGIEVVALNPMEVFTTSLGIAIAAGILVALPFVIYYLLMYLFPAMYKHEKIGRASCRERV